jgi:hypothetical protein
MVRRGIALHQIARNARAGRYDSAEMTRLRTFARAAQIRAQFLLAQMS